MKHIRFLLSVVLLFTVAALVMSTFAADAAATAPGSTDHSGGTLNEVFDSVKGSSAGWWPRLQTLGKQLFGALFVIAMVWKFGQHLLTSNHNISGFFFELLSMLIFGGFWYWHLQHGDAIMNSVVDSFSMLGAQQKGAGQVDAGKILWSVFDVWDDIMEASNGLGYIDQAIMALIAVGVVVVAALVAANLLVLMCAGKIMCYGGLFYFGFAGSPWTSDIAKNYYKSVLGIGVNIYATLLLARIGAGTFVEFAEKVVAQREKTGEGGFGFQSLLAMAVTAVVMASVIMKVPPMLAGIVNAPTGAMAPAISGVLAAAKFATNRVRDASNLGAAVQGARAKMAQDNKTRAAEGKAETTGVAAKTFEVAKNLMGAGIQNFRQGGASGGVAKILEDKVAKGAEREKEAKTQGGGGNDSRSNYASSVPDGGSGADGKAGDSGGGAASALGSGGNSIGGGAANMA